MDKEALFSPLPTAEVHISVGTVTVRGMSRAEALGQLANCEEGDDEAVVIHLCMMDPKLSFEEAKKWATEGPSRDIEEVVGKALLLTGGAPGQNLERPFREG
jgi:hypothetical protein